MLINLSLSQNVNHFFPHFAKWDYPRLTYVLFDSLLKCMQNAQTGVKWNLYDLLV